jgi:hypothetical protein
MIQWRKSSHSQDDPQSECVEVSATTSETTLIRDSKNPAGPHITLTPREFTDLISKIKAGHTP